MGTSPLSSEQAERLRDPRTFLKILWPDVRFYKKQWEVVESVRDNDETIVVAGNMLGKDFISAFIVLWFFMTRHPCRVVTTSADYQQLDAVLWGEIRRFIQTSKFPLDSKEGGPIINNHLHLKKIVNGSVCGFSYCMGRVAQKGEGMLGHHVEEKGDGIPRTLFLADESSGVDDLSWERADTWAKRKLAIGNPYQCNNFFFRGVEEGSIRHDQVSTYKGYHEGED